MVCTILSIYTHLHGRNFRPGTTQQFSFCPALTLAQCAQAQTPAIPSLPSFPDTTPSSGGMCCCGIPPHLVSHDHPCKYPSSAACSSSQASQANAELCIPICCP